MICEKVQAIVDSAEELVPLVRYAEGILRQTREAAVSGMRTPFMPVPDIHDLTCTRRELEVAILNFKIAKEK